MPTQDATTQDVASHDLPGRLGRVAGRETAAVVAFPGASASRFRREPRGEAGGRGEILLFTGVRYERMPEPAATEAGLLRRRS